MEVQLLRQKKLYAALKNLAKEAKAALTAARTSANSCPPISTDCYRYAIWNPSCRRKDYKGTALLLFYETMETFTGQEDPRGLLG
jgi:hypothetical protein